VNEFELDSKRFVREFLMCDKRRRFVFGTGDFGRSLARAIPIEAFVDDYSNDDWCDGVRVVKSDQIPKDGLVVVAGMLRTFSICSQLREAGVDFISYYAFERFCDLPVKPLEEWDQFAANHRSLQHRLNQVRTRLFDDLSRETWDRLIDFRLRRDLGVMDVFKCNFEDQYFEPFLNLKTSGEVFADVGAFQGETSIKFATVYPGFEHIFAFEPSTHNRMALTQAFQQLDQSRSTILPFALSDKNSVISFDPDSGSSSSVLEHGRHSVEAKRLDSLGLGRVTFIKMDVEGHESAALAGATETIRSHQPLLAISAYHKALDFVELPELLNPVRGSCSLAMRHYSEGRDETVLFWLRD
jgi:FkbM family methyltransferase